MPGPPIVRGLCINVDNHLSLRMLLLAGEIHLLPHQTEEPWTPMVIPLPVRLQCSQCHCRGHKGSRGKKQLAPARLEMPIFKLTDPGAEVMYTLWHFDVDAFLKQYDEASMWPHIFATLNRNPGKWARPLDEGKDISMQDLLMHMEKMFGNKHDYSAMIRTLYKVQQKGDKTVEEYMLCIHDVVMVICHMYLERLPDHGRDLRPLLPWITPLPS